MLRKPMSDNQSKPEQPKAAQPKRLRRPSAPRSCRQSKQSKAVRRVNPVTWLFIGLGAVAVVVVLWLVGLDGYRGDSVRVTVPHDATASQVRDSLDVRLGKSMGKRVYTLWRLMGGTPSKAHGSYLVTRGEMALKIARNLSRGRQTPVTVTFNNIRTMPQLADKMASMLDFSSEEFLEACRTVLPPMGFSDESQYPAAFLPDSYEFYWTASAEDVVAKLAGHRNRFWTDERRDRARALGLSPVEVATVASIAEEETAKKDERPMVARLYLNRIDRGMKLQADPTVKYAIGDFSIRRITNSMLSTPSPYNTYVIKGLPPGPIRIADAATIDGVLNAPRHGYLYMCAREDFSGYHNFASDYAAHRANAARYRSELDRRGIK